MFFLLCGKMMREKFLLLWQLFFQLRTQISEWRTIRTDAFCMPLTFIWERRVRTSKLRQTDLSFDERVISILNCWMKNCTINPAEMFRMAKKFFGDHSESKFCFFVMSLCWVYFQALDLLKLNCIRNALRDSSFLVQVIRQLSSDDEFPFFFRCRWLLISNCYTW